MPGSEKERIEKLFRGVAAGAATAAAVIGAVYFVSWMTGSMTYLGFQTITIKTNTALCAICCGIAILLLTPERPSRIRRFLAAVLAAAALLLAGLTLLEHVTDWDLGIDQLLAEEPEGALGIVYPNRMGPPAAVTFPLLGVAILLLLTGRRRQVLVAQWLGMLACLIGFLGMLGYLYGAEGLYGVAKYTTIAWQTAVIIFLLGSTLPCLTSNQGVMAVITAKGPGGVAIRRLLLPAFVVPVTLGWLVLQGEWYALYEHYFGTCVLVISLILVFSVLIYQTGKQLNSMATAEQRAVEERQRTQTLLLEAEKLSHTGAWEWDLQKDLWTFSDEWLSIHGVTQRTLTPAELLTFAHPEDQASIQEAFEALRKGERNYEIEHRIVRQDNGAVRVVKAQGQLVKDALGRVIRVFGFVQDVTEMKQAEEALRQAKDELEQRVQERTRELRKAYAVLERETEERIAAVEDLRKNEQLLIQQSRLAAMGEMLGNIAHQWRQPLNVLGLLIQQLSMDHEFGELTREHLEKEVSKAMQIILHMSQTINDFQNFLHQDKEKTSFNVNKVITTTIAMLDATLKTINATVEIDLKDDISITGHRNEFAQVVMNIITNARDAFRDRNTLSPKIKIALFKQEGKSVVTIADNAGGIAEAIIAKVFDPYFTTKSPERGTGIGLFMSKNIIEKSMNGKLTVRNTGEGAEFRIEV